MRRKDPSKLKVLSDKMLEALLELHPALQLAFLRRQFGIQQVQIAKTLHTSQTFISALEHLEKDHLLSRYQKFAKAIGCKIAVIPMNAKLISRRK